MRIVIVVCACFTCVSQARRVQTKVGNPAHEIESTGALNESQPSLANLKNTISGPSLLSEVALEPPHTEGRAQLVKFMASRKFQAQTKRVAEEMKRTGMPSDFLKVEYYAPGVLTGHPVRASAQSADARMKVVGDFMEEAEEILRPERKIALDGEAINNHMHSGEPVYFPRFDQRVISSPLSHRRGGGSVMADSEASPSESRPSLLRTVSKVTLLGVCLWVLITQLTSAGSLNGIYDNPGFLLFLAFMTRKIALVVRALKFFMLMRIYLSFFPSLNDQLFPFNMLTKVTNPIMAKCRKMLPKVMGFDPSIIIAFMMLQTLTFNIELLSQVLEVRAVGVS